MKIDVTFLERCVITLEKSLELLNKSEKKNIEYDMYRSACIKEFEIILEQSGKLLKNLLHPTSIVLTGADLILRNLRERVICLPAGLRKVCRI